MRCERIKAVYAIAFFFSFWRFLLLQSAVTVMRSKALHYTYVGLYSYTARERERWKLFKLQLQLRVISWIFGAAFLLRCREFQYILSCSSSQLSWMLCSRIAVRFDLYLNGRGWNSGSFLSLKAFIKNRCLCEPKLFCTRQHQERERGEESNQQVNCWRLYKTSSAGVCFIRVDIEQLAVIH